jgi:tetratricopeptide (TPR) repeat protein
MNAVEWIRRGAVVGALLGTLAMSGCAHHLASWIVETRDKQGARSLEAAHYKDAAHAFQLALKIDPDNQPARDGYVESQADLAETFYQGSQFQDALAVLDDAQKIDPQNVRIAGLIADVNNARLKSGIVHSNFPAYKETTDSLLKSYAELHADETEVNYRLKRFGYTYDTADLTGTITPESGSGPSTGSSSSLLPIP